MHPPASICQALYRLHPQLRLAWQGRAPKSPGELNPGAFAIVQLYHIRDCGGYSADVTTFREFWHTTTKMGEAGTAELVKIDRGPIFNRSGGTSLDYDPLFRFPIFVMTLDESFTFPWGDKIKSPEDVISGKFLAALPHWLNHGRETVERIRQNRRDKEAEVKAAASGIAGQISDRAMYEANKTGETRPIVAWKHARDQVRTVQQRSIERDPLDNIYGGNS